MKRSKRVLIIAACFFLLVLAVGSIYVYDRIAHILSASSLQQLLENNSQDKLSTFSTPKAQENYQNTPDPQSSDQQASLDTASIGQDDISQAEIEENSPVKADSNQEKATLPSNPTPSKNPAIDNKIASTLEKEVGRPVDTSDMLKAGFILMNKLSSEEINFLIGFSDKNYTSGELKKLREVLLSKLSAQDVETLRALADKYGKNLYILDPSVPIE